MGINGGKEKYPRVVMVEYPTGFWAGDEKHSSILVRVGAYALATGVFIMFYIFIIYLFLHDMFSVWNEMVKVMAIIVSILFSILTIKYGPGTGMLSNEKYARTKVLLNGMGFSDVIHKVEKALGAVDTTYSFDMFDLESKKVKYLSQGGKVEVLLSLIDTQVKEQYVFITIVLKNGGNDNIYKIAKEKISESFGISTYTAAFDPGIY